MLYKVFNQLICNRTFCVLGVGSRAFNCLAHLRRHMEVDAIIQEQVISERDASEGGQNGAAQWWSAKD